ncbi:energy-coupling factor ABC transporter substrate-binding protein [Tissierella creatinini]|nr:energy-coupling factor ABC transporter substrate-binding protein [Tissierella creatinini]TJX65610.1 energy-coupling factor ABC transporter substrate-binding protein [Soehngenia saccharolytica]
MKTSKTNLILFLLAIAIVLVPLIFLGDSEFGGADGEAGDVILEINSDYEPWAEPIWEPPSGEIESLLFSTQIAIGAVTIGYILGTLREKKRIADNR